MSVEYFFVIFGSTVLILSIILDDHFNNKEKKDK